MHDKTINIYLLVTFSHRQVVVGEAEQEQHRVTVDGEAERADGAVEVPTAVGNVATADVR